MANDTSTPTPAAEPAVTRLPTRAAKGAKTPQRAKPARPAKPAGAAKPAPAAKPTTQRAAPAARRQNTEDRDDKARLHHVTPDVGWHLFG
jgi:hypothetical protein